MSGTRHWTGVAERGSMTALRAMAWSRRRLGRRACQLLLHPIVVYFFLRGGDARRASRRYLERIWAMPEGRRQLRRRPGALAPFRHYHEFAVQLFDRLVLWGGGLDAFQMDHRGAAHLLALARERRGALLLGAHLGSFDMARRLATEHSFRLNVVMFTAHAERINRLFEQHDPECRTRVLQLDPDSVRTAFEIKACLDRGELVGMLADRIPAGGGARPIWIEFLGQRLPFPRSPFLLACLLGCPVYLSLCVRTGDARYETSVEPVGGGRPVPRSERDKAAEELAEAWVRRLEANCLRFPHQWFNFYDLWSAREEAA
jgi:predicted LPLAT superfamily acyltransferase